MTAFASAFEVKSIGQKSHSFRYIFIHQKVIFFVSLFVYTHNTYLRICVDSFQNIRTLKWAITEKKHTGVVEDVGLPRVSKK